LCWLRSATVRIQFRFVPAPEYLRRQRVVRKRLKHPDNPKAQRAGNNERDMAARGPDIVFEVIGQTRHFVEAEIEMRAR
jgi:hypothetical protein